MVSSAFDMSTLRAVALFAPLSDDELELLRPVLHVEDASVGTILIREGDPAVKMFVLLQGEVRVVTAHGTERERVVATLSPPEVFGEMALLTTGPCTATVVATDRCRFLSLEREGFESILREQPLVSLTLLKDAYDRLAAMNHQLANT